MFALSNARTQLYTNRDAFILLIPVASKWSSSLFYGNQLPRGKQAFVWKFEVMWNLYHDDCEYICVSSSLHPELKRGGVKIIHFIVKSFEEDSEIICEFFTSRELRLYV